MGMNRRENIMAESFIRKHYNLITSRWSAGDGKEIVHDGVISGATGVAIGYAAAHSKNDLEFTVARRRIPIDFAASVGAIAVSLGFGSKNTRDVVRQAGVTGLGIAAYRATEKYIHTHGRPMLGRGPGRPMMPPAAHAGDFPIGESNADPILAAAANLA
jgi:hypothetical protein